MQPGSTPPPRLPLHRGDMSANLRRAYRAVPQDPLPDDLSALLDLIAARTAPRPSRRSAPRPHAVGLHAR